MEASVAGSSAWRVNDVVAYERMRDAATTLTGLLLATGSPGGDLNETLAEVSTFRRAVLAVDGYDRAAVTELALRMGLRIAELAGDGRI